ncbi:MAG: hypothetical protein KC588_17240, partial [Nitrospira sp.]|nr:hypothetical protein [Nitrospira sp.]
ADLDLEDLQWLELIHKKYTAIYEAERKLQEKVAEVDGLRKGLRETQALLSELVPLGEVTTEDIIGANQQKAKRIQMQMQDKVIVNELNEYMDKYGVGYHAPDLFYHFSFSWYLRLLRNRKGEDYEIAIREAGEYLKRFKWLENEIAKERGD